ncbi:MAG: pyridoxamine 5'-phosphate oxidase family protein [Candidatus Omnitrophota bacterium]|nr:MAG: pyridoxamine 5'-phosphate oxidase family protein [Candidatus Omnitrophota bacterium]
MGVITDQIKHFLGNREFINVATCDFEGRPNVAPKFVLKIEGDSIYLVDYVIGKTFQNIKVNPKVSISTVNIDTLVGYQINGQVQIIDVGQQYDYLLEEFAQRQIQFSVKRIIEGVHRERKYSDFEVTFPEHVIVFKVDVQEVVEIIPTGELKRKKIDNVQ